MVRKMNPNSLENLKSGSITRNQGKIRCSITILPETKRWLARNGNLSACIDELVRKYLQGELVGSRALVAAEERIRELESEIEKMKILLNKYV